MVIKVYPLLDTSCVSSSGLTASHTVVSFNPPDIFRTHLSANRTGKDTESSEKSRD